MLHTGGDENHTAIDDPIKAGNNAVDKLKERIYWTNLNFTASAHEVAGETWAIILIA
jgi:hypothetical protein